MDRQNVGRVVRMELPPSLLSGFVDFVDVVDVVDVGTNSGERVMCMQRRANNEMREAMGERNGQFPSVVEMEATNREVKNIERKRGFE